MPQPFEVESDVWTASTAADPSPTSAAAHDPCDLQCDVDREPPPHARVLLVGPLPPPPLLGGIENGVALLLETPLAADARMTLFNTWRTPDPTRTTMHRLAYQLGASARFVAAVLKTRPTIVHVKAASGINYYQNAVYALLARVLGRRVVLQLHAGDFPQFYESASAWKRAAIRSSLRVPNRLVALSDSWAEYFGGLSGGRACGVVPNGLSVRAYDQAASERARFGIPDDRVAVLFVGTRDRDFDVQKGLPELLEAFRHVRARQPEAMLVLAGGAVDVAAVNAAIGRQGDAWLQVGVVVGPDKISLFRSIDVFVLPSRFENMPNTVLEAMAAARPVIATAVGAVPEMIEDGQSGFVIRVGDVAALAERLERLIADAALRTRLGRRAGELAANNYDMAVLERALRREYLRAQRSRSHAAPEPDGGALGDRADAAAPVPAPLAWWRQPRLQRRLRLVQRLLDMSGAEIAHRVARPFRKRRKRSSALDTVAPRSPLVAALAADPIQHLVHRTDRGFFSPLERAAIAARARTWCPHDVERTIRDATTLLEHGIDLLGKRFQPASPDFDWLADPDRGRVWPLTVLDDADAVRRAHADVKFVWEVNRHQFLPLLGRAYAYAQDERYAQACVDMFRAWRLANPVGIGVNWASNLEVAVRALSWIWTLHFIVGSDALTAHDARDWLTALSEHRDYLVEHLSTFTDPTNHLIGEVTALAAITLWLPELPASTELRDRALAMLDAELRRQVADDGVDREQSMSYQRFVLDFALQVIALADRGGVSIPPDIRSRARAMLEAVRALVNAHHRAPRIGDSDDARGVPFFTADPWDFGELLVMGAAVLDAPDLVPAGVAGCESALWIASGRTVPRIDDEREMPRSMLLGDDYAILRTPDGGRGERLIFDCGPLGYLPHASHGHADLLSILVDVDGEEVLIDPSSFAYWDEQRRRDLFRSTRMHNTVEIGGRDQADAFDPFKWLNIPRAGLQVAELRHAFDYVEAWHDGYRRLRRPVRHRRGVLRIDGAWLLIDWLEGRGTHRVCRWFHAAPTCRLEPTDRDSVRVATVGGRSALLVTDVSNSDARPTIECVTAPYSERYGRMVDAPVVRIAEVVSLPAVRVTMLAAQASGQRVARIAERFVTSRGDAVSVRVAERSGKSVQVVARASTAPHEVGRSSAAGRLAVVSGDGPAVDIFALGDIA